MISYSKISDNFFEYTYKWRAKYFKPLLKLISRVGIKPNDITFFRLLFTLPIGYYLFVEIKFFWAIIWYMIFWLIDTIDGALARYQNLSSDRGKFLDIFVDVFVHSFVLVGIIAAKLGDPEIFSYQILIHASVYILAVVYKQEGRPTDWVINPKPDITYLKFLSNLILALYAFFRINLINPGFILINVWMSGLGLYYFYKIYQKKTWKI